MIMSIAWLVLSLFTVPSAIFAFSSNGITFVLIMVIAWLSFSAETRTTWYEAFILPLLQIKSTCQHISPQFQNQNIIHFSQGWFAWCMLGTESLNLYKLKSLLFIRN